MTREVRECLSEMGVTEEVMAKIRSASNHTEGQKALDEAKEVCRRGFKTVAMEYHPDRNQHLEEKEREQKSRRFKRMKSVHDDFLRSRYRGPRRTNTRKGSGNFDPFGFYAAADQDLEDDLRYWNDPLLRNFMRMKRAEEGRRKARYAEVIEETKKRIYWQNLGLDYDEMRAQESKEKVVVLAGKKGVWYPERSRWILRTSRPGKSSK